jgi:stage IV sporulation protein A
MSNLVEDALVEKCNKMPSEIQAKLVKTTSRIVNEGKGGMICLLL